MTTWIIIAFVLLALVVWNNRRVSQTNRKRGQRNFKRNYKERKQARDSESKE